MENTGSYPYSKLVAERSEVRLLSLHPGSWDDGIQCDIKHASLDSNPDYEALSYTWGELTDLRSITMGGHIVEVRSNLEIALRYLRSQNETRTLWIDAVCINQEDIAERNAQVPRMYTIYCKARRVLAWLGEPGIDGEQGMELMTRFCHVVFKRHSTLDWNLKEMGITWLNSEGLDICNENWIALYNLWNRPYWIRMWVIQELAASIIAGPMLFDESVAKRPERCLIGCGGNWIDSKLYSSLGMYLTAAGPVVEALFNLTWTRQDQKMMGTPVDPERSYPAALRMYTVLKRTSQEFGSADNTALANMLKEVASFGAQDERDKVYGLLSLSRERDVFAPDYSIPVIECLMSIVRHHIAHTQTLDILLGNRRSKREGYPSWIPELSGFEAQSPAWFHSNLWGAGGREKTGKSMEVHFDLPQGLLHVRGFEIGRVSTAMGPFPASLRERRGFNAANRSTTTNRNPINSMLGYLNNLFQFVRNQDSFLRRQCLRALLLDVSHKGFDSLGGVPDNFDELFDILVGAKGAPIHLQLPGMEEPLMRYLLPVYSQMELNLSQRCFLVIDDEFVAVGPYCAQADDIVVILLGGAQCFVLRPCCCGTKFELIGDAYVYRFMDGNVCEDVLNGVLKRMELRIFNLY